MLMGLAALMLAACAEKGNGKASKTATPAVPAVAHAASPPEKLSIPQTQVALPAQQPISPEALAQAEAPPVLELPEAPAPRQPSRPSVARPAPPPTRTEPAQPSTPEPKRPIVQEQIPPAEQRRLTELVATRKREIAQRLDAVASRGATPEESSLVNRIRSFLDLADKATQRGDLRQADALAERAQILSRELSSGH
jgi:hypothetical protein